MYGLAVKSRALTFQKSLFYQRQQKPFKNDEKCFYSSSKLVPFLRYLNFCPDFFGHVGKQFVKKAMANLKIYDVTTWITSNSNKHIGQYLKK